MHVLFLFSHFHNVPEKVRVRQISSDFYKSKSLLPKASQWSVVWVPLHLESRNQDSLCFLRTHAHTHFQVTIKVHVGDTSEKQVLTGDSLWINRDGVRSVRDSNPLPYLWWNKPIHVIHVKCLGGNLMLFKCWNQMFLHRIYTKASAETRLKQLMTITLCADWNAAVLRNSVPWL